MAIPKENCLAEAKRKWLESKKMMIWFCSDAVET